MVLCIPIAFTMLWVILSFGMRKEPLISNNQLFLSLPSFPPSLLPSLLLSLPPSFFFHSSLPTTSFLWVPVGNLLGKWHLCVPSFSKHLLGTHSVQAPYPMRGTGELSSTSLPIWASITVEGGRRKQESLTDLHGLQGESESRLAGALDASPSGNGYLCKLAVNIW